MSSLFQQSSRPLIQPRCLDWTVDLARGAAAPQDSLRPAAALAIPQGTRGFRSVTVHQQRVFERLVPPCGGLGLERPDHIGHIPGCDEPRDAPSVSHWSTAAPLRSDASRILKQARRMWIWIAHHTVRQDEAEYG
jgi:hypothetical protein